MGNACSDNWYKQHFYEGQTFSVLQPKHMICHDAEEASVSPSTKEFATSMMMQLYIGAAMLLLILYRSCSSKRVDAFRLVFLYLCGTVGFALALNFGTSVGGFSRVLGYGVMVHNAAEWFIINRIWFGERSLTAKPVVIYIMAFIIAVTLLPLQPLWFIAMCQGGYCDYLLVFSTIYLVKWTGKQAEFGIVAPRKKYMCAGVIGAVLHLISIQPLFYGVSTAYSPLAYLTTLFLLPSFCMYIFWASSSSFKLNFVNPSMENEDKERAAIERSETILNTIGYGKKAEQELVEVVTDNTKYGKAEDQAYKDIILDVISRGIGNLDPSTKKSRNIIFISAFLLSFVNSIIIFMAPCYLDFSKHKDCTW